MLHMQALCALFCLAFATAANASPSLSDKPLLTLVQDAEPVSVTRTLEKLVAAVSLHNSGQPFLPQPSEAYVVCADVEEIASTSICVFNYRLFMNLVLNRAATYLESSRRLLDHNEHINSPLIFKAQGHDLTGPQLEVYWNAFLRVRHLFPQPQLQVEKEYLQLEEEFWERYVLHKIAQQKNFTLISVAIDTPLDATLSHELLHAQFFRDGAFRARTWEFWTRHVTPADQGQILQLLSKGYDIQDLQLVLNEFQAYLLMEGAESRLLRDFVPVYRLKLLEHLRSFGIHPVKIQPTHTLSPTLN